MPFFFQPPTPEQIAEMEEHQRHHEMMAEDYRHGVQALFTDLGRDHLTSMRGMLHSLAAADNDARLASYYEGLACAALYFKHGVCMGCGVNHDEQAAEALMPKTDEDGTPKPAEGSETPALEGLAELTPEDFKNMQEYNLDDVRDEGTLRLLGFICKGCGARYVSIADRMLRPPGVEGCGGCIERAKWG